MVRPALPASQRAIVLDAVRAGAALLVLLSHARDMLLRDAAAEPSLSFGGRAFMAVSGLGHQAVIAFFVLSGYLVTGAMARLGAHGHWSLPGFALARLTRLWVVLVPCLVLGAGLDLAGLAWRSPEAGALPYGIPPVPPAAVSAPALGPAVALANLAFLQTIAAPPFGSNGALWSLADEAWFYALAGLLFTAWRRRAAPLAALPAAAAAAVIVAALPGSVLQFALVWGCGAAAALLPARAESGVGRVLAAALACLAVLVASRLRLAQPLPLDLLLGVVVAILLRETAPLRWPGATDLATMVRGLSRLSYSLYASHCPVLALVAALTIGSRPRALAPGTLLLTFGAMGLCLAVAGAIWWLFERHTGRCRAMLARRAAGCRVAMAPAVAPGVRP